MAFKDFGRLDTVYKKALKVANPVQRKVLMLSQHLTDQIRAAESAGNKEVLLRLIKKQLRLMTMLAGTYDADDDIDKKDETDSSGSV